MRTMELCDIHKFECTSDTSKFISLEGVQSLKGKICTVLGKKFILALIENSIELVIIDDCYSSTDDRWNFFQSMKTPELTCNFLYGSDSKPYLLKNLDDGTEVNFDALRYGKSGNYLAFIVWIGPKCPSIIVEPLANSHVLYRQHLGVSVKILYMFKDSGNLCFENDGTSIYIQFFKGLTVIKMNELIDVGWNVEFFLQNFSKFVANIYEFRNNVVNEEPKFICTHLWLKGNAFIYSESHFDYNTLYNLDYNGALLNTIKPLGIIKYCHQRAIISTSNATFNIDIIINNDQEISFSCPLNNYLYNKLKPLLDKNNMANVHVHIKQVCLEQQRWSLYLVLNKDEKSFKSEIILKTFGEHLTLQEASNLCDVNMIFGICKDINPSLEGSLVDYDKSSVTTSELNYFSSNFNENNTNFSTHKYDSSVSIAKSDMKSSKLDLIMNNSNEPLLSQIECSSSDDGLSKKNSISDLNESKSKAEVHILKTSDDQCLIHSKKPAYKSTSNNHGERFLQHQCLFEKPKIIDASNVELWKDYFKNETPQISEATEVFESRNTTYQTATEFFNSILRPLAQSDELKSCHYFDNSLKHNPLMNIVGTPCIPLTLLNFNGSMYALKDKFLILTSIFNKIALIATKCVKKSIFNYSSYRIPLLLWRDGKPAPLTEFTKGCPVQFDAVMAPDDNYYQPLLIWTGTKPNHIPFLKMNASKTLMLSDIYDNASVTQTVSKSGEKQLEFIDGNETKICRTFEKFTFKANKIIKGQINKLIEFHNNEVISQYIFSLHSNCLELEFGQHYSIDESSEVFNIKELPNNGGLHLDVPMIIQKCQGFCIMIFTIEDERISMSTQHPNLQELFHSSSTKRVGIAHIFRQDIPRSFNVLLVSINDEVGSEFLDESQYTISNSSFTSSVVRAPQTFFIFNVNDNHFQLIEINVEIDPTFDPQEASLNYMTLPKLTFSPECKSVATSRGMSPANMVTAEAKVLRAKKDIGLNSCDTVCEDSAKKTRNISAMNSCKNIMQKLNHLITTNNGKVSDNAMCYKSVFRNCSGTLYLKNKVSVIDIVTGTKHIEIYPPQEGFMQVDGRARKLLTVDKPASIKLDMFYDKVSKRHKITAIWAGKKSKTMIVSNEEQHFFDIVGQLMGNESRTVRLRCFINGNFVNIVTYKSKRVFDENGTKLMDELTIGCPVLVHLKKVITAKKVCWEILMMIELTDKIIDHLFPTSVVNRGTHTVLYSATMISKLYSRKLQINEISHIFKELTSKYFAIIFGKITSEELESIAIKGTYEGESYNLILKRNIFLDDPCELSICEICLIAVPQIKELIPFKILTGWYKRLLVNCCILVNYTHEHIMDNIVKLKNGVDNNISFAFMTKNVCILSNSHNKSSLYYLVQHCPSMKSSGLEITKIVLLCSDSWLLALTCMMTISKEFDEKINELKY